jgi:hypothetical protein
MSLQQGQKDVGEYSDIILFFFRKPLLNLVFQIFMSTQDMIDFHAELLNRCLNFLGMDEEENEFKGLGLTEDAKEMMKEVTGKSSGSSRKVQHSNPIEFLKLHGNMTQKDRLEVK